MPQKEESAVYVSFGCISIYLGFKRNEQTNCLQNGFFDILSKKFARKFSFTLINNTFYPPFNAKARNNAPKLTTALQ